MESDACEVVKCILTGLPGLEIFHYEKWKYIQPVLPSDENKTYSKSLEIKIDEMMELRYLVVKLDANLLIKFTGEYIFSDEHCELKVLDVGPLN